MSGFTETDQEMLRRWCDDPNDQPPGLEAWALVRRLATHLADQQAEIHELRDTCIDLNEECDRLVGDRQ